MSMKYRVRVDLSFDSEADARTLLGQVRALAAKAVPPVPGGPNVEVSYWELELCRHDEGLPCRRLERGEVR